MKIKLVILGFSEVRLFNIVEKELTSQQVIKCPTVFSWVSNQVQCLMFCRMSCSLPFSKLAFSSNCGFLFLGFGTKLSDKVNHFIFFSFYHFCSCNINFLFLLIYRKSLVKVY